MINILAMRFILLLLLFGLTFTACKKKKKDREDLAVVAADNASAENSFNDIKTMSDEAAKGENNFKSFDASCVTITYDTLPTSKLITVDFGTVNCLCQDGKNRRGKVKISYTGTYNQAGNIIVTSTENYFVNDNKIEGTKTATNISTESYSVVTSGTITKTDGGVITWQADKTRTRIAGMSTLFNWFDDVYEFRGTASGTSSNGTTFSISTITSLNVLIGCGYIRSGKLKIIRNGSKEATLDYGDGSCDNKAMLTIGNKTSEIALHSW